MTYDVLSYDQMSMWPYGYDDSTYDQMSYDHKSLNHDGRGKVSHQSLKIVS